MNRTNLARSALAGAILMSMGSAASAITLEGDTLWFSFDETTLNPLFGSFSVTGDTLTFDPTTWVAQTFNGISVANATTPQITVTAKTNFLLTGASLHEQGDYFRIGSPAGEVGVGGQFILDNSPIGISAGALTDVTTIGGLTPSEWNVDSAGSLSGTSGLIKLENILIAGALGDGANLAYAFVEKKLIEISVGTQAVPLPPAAWMLGSALVGLVTVGRRKFAS